LLAFAGLKVTAIDVPGKTLEFCKHRNKIQHTGIEVVDLGVDFLLDYKSFLRTHRYDAVICLDVLEHLPSWDIAIELLTMFKSAATVTYANVTGGKFFGLHPMHLDAPSALKWSVMKELYVEAYE
jgi:2-polyprenyl-3-methyl-5-hydroxy-6-metoxy-1,4-benzoquinol methylase